MILYKPWPDGWNYGGVEVINNYISGDVNIMVGGDESNINIGRSYDSSHFKKS